MIFTILSLQFKGTVHLQLIFLKYVMLRTVTKYSTIIITKYTCYHRYREIIQITGGLPLQLHQMPDLKGGRRKSNALMSLGPGVQSSHRHQLVFLVLLKLSSIIPHFSKQLESSCNGSSGSNWYCCVSFMAYFLQDYCVLFWNYTSLTLVYMLLYRLYKLLVKLLGSSGISIQEYLICGWSFSHFDIIYNICEYSCISPENLKWRWTVSLKALRQLTWLTQLIYLLKITVTVKQVPKYPSRIHLI